MTGRSVALVHDYLLVARGAERTFAAMADCWPHAPIFTLLLDREAMGDRLAGRAVHTSTLQRLGIGQRGFRGLLPLYPRAVERLPVGEYDVVVSSSSAFAHGVRPGPDAIHVCYCYTPFRYAWHERSRAVAETPAPLRPAMRRVLGRIRAWDIEASQRVTRYIAISELGRQRIAQAYGREAAIVHPPVETHRFSVGEPEDFFLIVCELVPHKNVETAIEAAARAGARLRVVGDGPDRKRLARRYDGRVEFLGRVSDEELAGLYPRALAIVVPNVEEFGIAAVEGQAAGRPVLAPDAGGTRETIVDGITGVLLQEPHIDAFADAMHSVDWRRFDPLAISGHAQRFSVEAFQRRLRTEVERVAAL